jgi:hypothetical protein
MTVAQQAADEIARALAAYIRLPEHFELNLLPEGIHLHTHDFPCLVAECAGLDLRKYFHDALAVCAVLSQDERKKLADDLFELFATVTAFKTGEDGALFQRSKVSIIDLPPSLTQGFLQQMHVDSQVTFKLVAQPPDQATFSSVAGITFTCGGKVLGMPEFSLRADADKCYFQPAIEECGSVKQNADNVIDALKNKGRDLLVGIYVKTQKVRVEFPIVLEEFRTYLQDAMEFKRTLQLQEKDLLTFVERCAKITVDDPFTRSLLGGALHLSRSDELVSLKRRSPSVCQMGNVVVRFASEIKFALAKKLDELELGKLCGVDLEVPFDSPSDLKAIGLDLTRALPNALLSLNVTRPDEEGNRKMTATIGQGKWITLFVDNQLKLLIDTQGNWMLFGVTKNPISGNPQGFFLRLDKDNNLNMTARELLCLVNQTAMQGFNPDDPLTWQWGALSLGTQTLLAAGSILRSAIGDEQTDKLGEKVKKVGKFIGKLFS